MSKPVYDCPQGEDAALQSIKNFVSKVEDSAAAIKAAKEKVNEVPDGEGTIGKLYTDAIAFIDECDTILTQQYPDLVRSYEQFTQAAITAIQEAKSKGI